MRLQPAAFSLCLMLAAVSGCTGLGLMKPELNAELSQTGAPAPEGSQVAKVDVIFQPEKGQPERLERSLAEPTTVQQILVQTSANKKYRRMEVEILRQLPSGGFHKIPCEYDRTTKKINPEFDYALMPADRVIVKEDTSTIIDDMMQSAGGSLGKRFTTGGKHKPSNRYRMAG